MNYTDRIDGFQICDPSYVPGFEPKCTTPVYDIVKWYTHEPLEVYDMLTREKKTVTESCYVVARLGYDTHEPCFDFESIGLRWLEAHPTQAIIDAITEFAEKKADEIDSQTLMEKQSWEVYADYCVCPFCRTQSSAATKFCPSCGRRVFRRY